jgi:hypothetical protein
VRQRTQCWRWAVLRYNARLRRCGRVVECTGLENRRRGNPSVSSNLTASATKYDKALELKENSRAFLFSTHKTAIKCTSSIVGGGVRLLRLRLDRVANIFLARLSKAQPKRDRRTSRLRTGCGVEPQPARRASIAAQASKQKSFLLNWKTRMPVRMRTQVRRGKPSVSARRYGAVAHPLTRLVTLTVPIPVAKSQPTCVP